MPLSLSLYAELSRPVIDVRTLYPIFVNTGLETTLFALRGAASLRIMRDNFARAHSFTCEQRIRLCQYWF